MNLYLVQQAENNGYDSYDSFVVVADTEEEARYTHPRELSFEHQDKWWEGDEYSPLASWCDPKLVDVRLLGTAAEGTPKGVVCASFNAG